MSYENFDKNRFNLSESKDSPVHFVADEIKGRFVCVVYIAGQPRMHIDFNDEPLIFDVEADRLITEAEALYRLEQAGVDFNHE